MLNFLLYGQYIQKSHLCEEQDFFTLCTHAECSMERSNKMFFAFTGKSIEQKHRILQIEDGFECWDLKQFTIDDCIEVLQDKIPPVNKNVISNYKTTKLFGELFGITEKYFEKASWGLLVPNMLAGSGFDYTEALHLLNLYSSNFLYPIFYANDMGIMPQRYKFDPLIHFHKQKHDPFQTKDFVAFYKILAEQSGYGDWNLDRIQVWKDEDWRLFVASLLFRGLTDFEHGKSPFVWQRESAEMATILEALFTAGDSQNEEVTYRLRKRIAVLLSWKYPDVEKEIKALYKSRSSFVHGSFFKQIAKKSPRAHNNIPLPDFNVLYGQKEYVRLALVAYLNLARVLKTDPQIFQGERSVMSALEKAIIDFGLRKKIEVETRKLFSLMPEPSFSRF